MLRKHEPAPESIMLRVAPRNTICQILRNIYLSTDDEYIKLMTRLATSMAKSMSKKLEKYKKNWDRDFFDKNPDFRKK